MAGLFRCCMSLAPMTESLGPSRRCVKQFSLDPDRLRGTWRKHQDQPIAALESGANLVVPLLRSHDIRLAVPHRDAVAT